MTSCDDLPADDTGYSECCMLLDADTDTIATLPLHAWPALVRWFSAPMAADVRPIQFVDGVGQVNLIDRMLVCRILRRDIDAVLRLEARERAEEAAAKQFDMGCE